MMSLGGPQRAAGWAVAALGAVAVGFGLFWSGPVQAEWEWVWVEGEKPYSSTVTRHPGWYDKVKRDLLSGGDFLSHWDDKRPGEALYRVKGPKAGEYDLWVRANPVQSRLSYKLNDGDEKRQNYRLR